MSHIIIRLSPSEYRAARKASPEVARATDITPHCAKVVEMFMSDEERHYEETEDTAKSGHIVHSLRAIDPERP